MTYRSAFLLFLPVLLLLGVSPTAFAADEDIPIDAIVGSDITPPTVPANLTATPIAISQINLTWDPSTDDFLLAGYQVFRDSVQVATTTMTNYTDVGLTPSTTYTYYVTAFDSANNISASSSPVSTTTFAIPPPEEISTSTSSGRRATLLLTRLEVIPEREYVTIRYETSGPVQSVIRWGRTASYELGSIAERTFTTRHETKIMGLTPGTKYTFVIGGENQWGRRARLKESAFNTLPSHDLLPPGNVLSLRARQGGDDILLSWVNPKDSDLAKVRIVRNSNFYPSDTADGWVVYEGLAESFRDKGVAREGTTLFYTVFTYDILGNVSSGAIVSVRTGGAETVPVEVVDETINPIALKFSDLGFFQDNTRVYPSGSRVTVDGSKALEIMLPYERVPEHLKTILVSLTDEEGKKFAFLLRIDAEKSGYKAHLAPFGISDSFGMKVSVFDFKTAQIGYTEGTLISHIVATESEIEGTEEPPLPWFLDIAQFMWSRILWFVLLFLIILYVTLRLREEAD